MQKPFVPTLGGLLLASLLSAVSAPASSQAVPNAMPEMPAPPRAASLANRYVVDPTHTFVMYEMGHYGTSTNRGRFSTKEGMVQIDASGTGGQVDIDRHEHHQHRRRPAEPPCAKPRLSERGRFPDRALHGPDHRAGRRHGLREIPGTLTMLGQTHPVVLRANRFNCYMSPVHGQQVCGGDFDATIERSRWASPGGCSSALRTRCGC